MSFGIFPAIRRSRNTFFLGLSRLRSCVRRNPAEMSHTCRGTISLHGALIHTVDACTFVVSNGGTQTFHIKAATEVERQQWVTALELAKAKAIKAMESGTYDCHRVCPYVVRVAPLRTPSSVSDLSCNIHLWRILQGHRVSFFLPFFLLMDLYNCECAQFCKAYNELC